MNTPKIPKSKTSLKIKKRASNPAGGHPNKGGRPKKDNAKNFSCVVNVSEAEAKAITSVANQNNLSISKLLRIIISRGLESSTVGEKDTFLDTLEQLRNV